MELVRDVEVADHGAQSTDRQCGRSAHAGEATGATGERRPRTCEGPRCDAEGIRNISQER